MGIIRHLELGHISWLPLLILHAGTHRITYICHVWIHRLHLVGIYVHGLIRHVIHWNAHGHHISRHELILHGYKHRIGLSLIGAIKVDLRHQYLVGILIRLSEFAFMDVPTFGAEFPVCVPGLLPTAIALGGRPTAEAKDVHRLYLQPAGSALLERSLLNLCFDRLGPLLGFLSAHKQLTVRVAHPHRFIFGRLLDQPFGRFMLRVGQLASLERFFYEVECRGSVLHVLANFSVTPAEVHAMQLL